MRWETPKGPSPEELVTAGTALHQDHPSFTIVQLAAHFPGVSTGKLRKAVQLGLVERRIEFVERAGRGTAARYRIVDPTADAMQRLQERVVAQLAAALGVKAAHFSHGSALFVSIDDAHAIAARIGITLER